MTPRRDMHDKRNDWDCGNRRNDEPVHIPLRYELMAIFGLALGLAAIVPAAYVLHEMVDVLWTWIGA